MGVIATRVVLVCPPFRLDAFQPQEGVQSWFARSKSSELPWGLCVADSYFGLAESLRELFHRNRLSEEHGQRLRRTRSAPLTSVSDGTVPEPSTLSLTLYK